MRFPPRLADMSLRTLAVALAVSSTALVGCGTGLRTFPMKAPMWRDADARPFPGEPEEYYSSLLWDGADQMAFRPIARFWAVDPGRQAINVNSLDEVPDSSWFVNRIGKAPMTADEVRRGPCTEADILDPKGPWTAVGAKPNGDNPGFPIKDHRGRTYLLKFDSNIQGVRPTAADTIVSKLYHAAGFNPPCNQIINFDRKIVTIAPDAKSETATGEKVKMTEGDLDKVFNKALKLKDGRYRGSASLYLAGKPLGPFRYEGTRSDDPNDVVAHEDRRELRGHRLLAAWTGHTDAREQNTLDMFVQTGEGQGFVRHHIIDFGDCLGSVWEPPMMGRRLQHSSYFDGPEIFEDWITFGLVKRPWDDNRFGPAGKIWGYFKVENFDPEEWEPGYPNPAMLRMNERDGAWMARVLAKLDGPLIKAAIEAGKIPDPAHEKELYRILMGRRQKILARYLTRLSPLSWPKVEGRKLCLEDLAITGDIIPVRARRYSARAWGSRNPDTTELSKMSPGTPVAEGPTVCVDMPRQAGATADEPAYLIVDVIAAGGSAGRNPARVHLYDRGEAGFFVAGLERPEDPDRPGE